MAGGEGRKIKLFHVPLNHRGSTEHLLKEAVKDIQWPDYSNILYIAPTPVKLIDARKRFHALIKSPYIPPRFFTLKQLSKYLFDIEMPGRYLPRISAPLLISGISGHSIGYSSMLSELLMELKQHHPSKKLTEIRHDLTGIFKKAGIPEDALKRLDGAMDIFEKYQDELSYSKYYDEDDILNLGRLHVKGLTDIFPVLVADGFYDMTTSEKNLFAELIKKAGQTLIALPDDITRIAGGLSDFIKSSFTVTEEHLKHNSEVDLSYIKYNSIEDEVEGIARHIKNLHITGKLKAEDSIIVTFPKISSYTGLAERVFKRYGLPFTISTRKPLSQKAPLRDLLFLLESIADDFPRLKFTSVLNSSCFKIIPDMLREQIPAISLKSGIIRGRESWENLSSVIEDKAISSSVKNGLNRIFSILERLIRLKDSASPVIFHAEIDSVLSELHFEAGQDNSDALNNAMEIIDIIPGLSGEKTISLKRYTEFLRHILGSAEYQHEDEGIQIMDFFETRGLEPDYLYFCGLKDGDIPSKPPLDHILPDSVRTEYGLINLNKYLAVQKLNFFRITGSSENIHLSYPAIEGDKLFLPSPYLPWGREIPEKVFGIFSVEELQVREGSGKLSDSIREIHLDNRTMGKLLGKQLSMPLRVTDIDYFRKCPRRFFIEKVLDLQASQTTEYEIEPKMLGTILHRVMEDLLKEPLDDIHAVKVKASTIIDVIIKDYAIEAYWKSLFKETFIEILHEIIEIETELRHEGYTPYELEMNVRGEVLPGISLKGKIDRIDRCDNQYRIIDYKTGTVNISSDIIRKGKDLQLPLYAAMLKSKEMPVEKAGIYSLKDIEIKWIPTKRDKNSIDDYITGSLRFLAETVNEIREGSFNARPAEDFYCSSCNEAPFCPYINSKGELQYE